MRRDGRVVRAGALTPRDDDGCAGLVGGGRTLKFDAMLPAQPLRRARRLGRRAAEAGLSGLVVTEAGRTAYLTCGALAVAADIDV